MEASFYAVLVVGLALVARCVIAERWVTLFGAVALVVGAMAGFRWRTWSVGLLLCTGTAFLAAHLLGMAPAWFWGVGIVSALPFVFSWRPMAFFDRAAAALYALLAVSGGILCALGLHEYGGWIVAHLHP